MIGGEELAEDARGGGGTSADAEKEAGVDAAAAAVLGNAALGDTEFADADLDVVPETRQEGPAEERGPVSVEVGGDHWRLVLRPLADAPRLARDFVVDACRKWRAPWWDATGTLITSELVTNAVRHAGTRVVLRLDRRPDGLVISVDDEGGGLPRIVPAEERVSGGRGLAIVAELSAEWGVSTRSGGKTVWARLAPLGAEPADDEDDDGTGEAGQTGLPADETVVLELPWGKDLVVVARSTAAHLGARAGFTLRQVEDLRLAVDEACNLLLLRAMTTKKKPEIQCRFTVSSGAVAFAVSAPLADRSAPAVDDFGWNLLEALVDEVEWSHGSLTCGVRGLKRVAR